jgi:hypothetical protein
MHEIAKATPVALAILVLATASFSEVGYGRQFSIEWASWTRVNER